MAIYRYDGTELTAEQAGVRALEKGKAAYPAMAAEFDAAIEAIRARGADAVRVWNATTKPKTWGIGDLLAEMARDPHSASHPDYPVAMLNTMIIYGGFRVEG